VSGESIVTNTALPTWWTAGTAAFSAGVPVEVANALSRAAHDHMHKNGGASCPHDIGLVLADAIAPFWTEITNGG
jgi:hypothetical protein